MFLLLLIYLLCIFHVICCFFNNVKTRQFSHLFLTEHLDQINKIESIFTMISLKKRQQTTTHITLSLKLVINV